MVVSFWKRRKREGGILVSGGRMEQMAKLLYTLFFGFFAGVLGMILKKESLLYGTGFLDSYTLGPMKYLDPDAGKLLVAILMQRLGAAAFLIILATTYLGSVTAYLYQAWNGLALGVLAAGSVLRYGLKGLLLAAGSLFPQQLILIPAFLMLSVKCCELCGSLYFAGGCLERERGKFLAKKFLDMMASVILIAAGCFVEACINPGILKAILRFF